VVLIPLAGTDRSEPMEDGGLVTKIGFDATSKTADRAEGVDRALPPAEATLGARRWFLDKLAPGQRAWLKP
jgi:4-hydroxy-3-polyprenylbenzoate decarboxylase